MSRLRAPGTLDAMNSSDVTVTLKDMWATRPAAAAGRPARSRASAAAIARRYDLDPVLVRVGLVAAAFNGVGLALYVARLGAASRRARGRLGDRTEDGHGWGP